MYLSNTLTVRIYSIIYIMVIFILSLITTIRAEVSKLEIVDIEMNYGIIIDAGSSGSRVRVYQWSSPKTVKKVPQIKEIFKHKIKPGVSSFVDNNSGLRNHILTLVNKAKNEVPESKQPTTPIYLMATAGMRLLLETKANTIFENINNIFMDRSTNPFMYAAKNSRILSGEEEGVFGWIAVNYLKGFFSDDEVYDSVGVLEMGGASTQITFMPRGNILAYKFPVRIAGRRYSLYSHSYLYYGQDKAQERVRRILTNDEENANKSRIDNPCMLQGDSYIDTKLIPERNIIFNGTGDPEECIKKLEVFVYKANSERCYPKPCAIGSVYQPSMRPGKAFYAVGAYGVNIRPRQILDIHKRFSPAELLESSKEYCRKDLETVRNETKRTDPFLSAECLMGLYIPKLLTVGYGFDENEKRIIASTNINGQEAEWSLGALIYEIERSQYVCPTYASKGSLLHPKSYLKHIYSAILFILLVTYDPHLFTIH